MFKSGKALAYILYFAVVAVLGGFIVAAFHSSSTPAKPRPPIHQQTARPVSPAQPKSKPTPSPSSPSAPATPTTNGALADSGPGDVAGLFVAASLAGAGVYRYLLVRRLTQAE